MKRLLLLLVLLAPVGVQAHEIRVGVLLHDIAHWWGYTKLEKGVSFNGEFVCGEDILRVVSGVSINSHGGTSYIYSGMGLNISDNFTYVELSVGGACHRDSKRELGSVLLFRLSLEVGYKKLSILYSHLSNGAGIVGLDISNAGLDEIGIRYKLRF